jgi:NAD+ kinase
VRAPLDGLLAWTRAHDVELVQIPAPGSGRHFAPEGAVADCDLVVSVGGDGTMLAAIRAALHSAKPVLGIACGSLGVLTRTAPSGAAAALDAIAAGRSSTAEIPGLHVVRDGDEPLLAFNDLAVVRAGLGQIRLTIRVDGSLYGRLAGDGAVVATALGSSAYSLAAGGPLLALDSPGVVLTPLAAHGAGVPPLVAGPAARLELEVDPGVGGARLELDGQIIGRPPARLTIERRPDVARFVTLPGAEPWIGVLRRRGLVRDSPRILAEDGRVARRDRR